MKKTTLLLIVITTLLYSCGKEHKTTEVKNTKQVEKTETVEHEENQNPIATTPSKYIDTKYEYSDQNNKKITIENSLPKGGLKYTYPMDIEYIYAVFWTRITNQTDNTFEFTMEFPEKSYQLPSAPDRYFKLYIPTDTITANKEELFNYGLDLQNYLDNNFHTQTPLKRTIQPKESCGFYVITLFNKGVEGTIRTGLSIKEQNLFYRVNDNEIQCGNINLKILKPKQ